MPKENDRIIKVGSTVYDFSKPDCLDIPAKPIDIKKPINGFDYLNALIRIPEVIRDSEVFKKEPTEEKLMELVRKYFGVYGFSPELLQHTNKFHKHNKYYSEPEAIHVFSNWEKDGFSGGHSFSNWEKNYFSGGYSSLSRYRDGRHVILAVDVTKKKQTIFKELDKLLVRIKKDYGISGDTTRDRDVSLDIWKIYDYKTQEKLNFTQIARKVSGLKGNPSYNERLKARLNAVKRAYSKAEEIVNRVKEDVQRVITENEKEQKARDEVMKMSKKQVKIITIADRLLGRV